MLLQYEDLYFNFGHLHLYYQVLAMLVSPRYNLFAQGS